MMLTSKSWFLLLLLLLLVLVPAPTLQLDLAHRGKLPPISSVSKRGGGGHGVGGHGGGGHGRGGQIPVYAAGAAGAGSHRHHNGAVMNRGRPNSRQNLGIVVLVALVIGFKRFW
ncbi:hypothetical protein LINPERPRIM_LOCUS7916 [Linum perenne]